VGCVLVRDGELVGEGATEPPGGRHAERQALDVAGARAAGSTAYVTLEPCSHDGRTPPCADALVEAGVTRVVIALADPDPRVSGGGIARLRAAGISVDVGIGADAVADDLAPYLHHRSTGRSYCLVKAALSLDGRVAAADGSSHWITGEAARADSHRLRADSQAIVVGSGTALADHPVLTARPTDVPVERQPLRVLLDGRGRVPASGPLFEVDLAATLVCTTEAAPPAARAAWLAMGAKVEVLPASRGGGVDLRAALELLARLDVLQAMVEGGPTVHGALVRAGLVDRLVAYVAGTVLGPDGRAGFDAPFGAELDAGFPPALADAPRLRLLGARALGDDVRLDYVPANRTQEPA
jgi:diaminohydroxyphosphoribosylaminopyrimidine deaminase/5-amino-6-(5-phosphoribosylamino)uracil reductase